MRLERGHGAGHREVGLAGAGGADAEGEVVRADGLDVALLREPAGPDGAPPGADGHRVVEHVAELDVRLAPEHAERPGDVVRLHVDALARERGRLGEEPLGQRDVRGVALEQDLVAPQPDRDAAPRARGPSSFSFRGPASASKTRVSSTSSSDDALTRALGPTGCSHGAGHDDWGTRPPTVAGRAIRRPGSRACATRGWRPCARRDDEVVEQEPGATEAVVQEHGSQGDVVARREREAADDPLAVELLAERRRAAVVPSFSASVRGAWRSSRNALPKHACDSIDARSSKPPRAVAMK